MKPKRGIGNICFDIDGTLCNEVCFTEAEVRKATLNKKMANMKKGGVKKHETKSSNV